MVVFSDWAGFPLYRERVLDGRSMACGLGHIMDNALRYDPGMDFDAILIINETPYSSTFWDAFKSVILFAPYYREEKAEQFRAEKQKQYTDLQTKYPFLKKIYFRDNLGQDFGAYNFAIQKLREQSFGGEILLMNSSLEGPFADGWLKKYYDLFHSKDNVGLCGISLHSHNTNIQDNPPFAPHVGSYLLYTSMDILNKVYPADITGADTDDKNEIIAEGEIGISRDILNDGYSICCLAHPGFYYENNGNWDIPSGALPSNRKI